MTRGSTLPRPPRRPSSAPARSTSGDSKRVKLIDSALAASMRRAVYATSLEPAMLQPVLANAVGYGMLEKPIGASELIWPPPAK